MALEFTAGVHSYYLTYVNDSYTVAGTVGFFQPVMNKTRHGAKVHKVYDMAQTPYHRLLKAGVVTESKQRELVATYHGLNPVTLLSQINETLERLWTMAEHPAYQQRKVNPVPVPNGAKTYMASVT